jgi:hypothetical protein
MGAMPLLRCASCRIHVELVDAVTVARCGACNGTLLPTLPGVVAFALDDDPTQPHGKRPPTPAPQTRIDPTA